MINLGGEFYNSRLIKKFYPRQRNIFFGIKSLPVAHILPATYIETLSLYWFIPKEWEITQGDICDVIIIMIIIVVIITIVIIIINDGDDDEQQQQ